MWPETAEKPVKLRYGLTTGSCATACSVAAAKALLTGKKVPKVEIELPKGKLVELLITSYEIIDAGNKIRVTTIKDAGDDPDVTHGATIFVELSLIAPPVVEFSAASGVGTVTREGLALAVNEPAINPVPRQMITTHLMKLAKFHQYHGGFHVAIGVVKGEILAQKTMNPRLGILGGLSILGTTGIVRPYSCSAYIASIHQGIDVAHANGIKHIAATTGSSSEQAIIKQYKLPEMALLEMGDFVGAVLKYLKKPLVNRLSICGGFGKITKLSQHHMNLNSRQSAIDFDYLAQVAKNTGAGPALIEQIKQANTSIEVLTLCQQNHLDIATPICQSAYNFVKSKVHPSIEIDIWTINRQGQFVGHIETNI